MSELEKKEAMWRVGSELKRDDETFFSLKKWTKIKLIKQIERNCKRNESNKKALNNKFHDDDRQWQKQQ